VARDSMETLNYDEGRSDNEAANQVRYQVRIIQFINVAGSGVTLK